MGQHNYIPGLLEFPLTAFPVVDHLPWKLHRHGDHAELVIITGGRAKHVLETESFPIERGDVFFVPLGLPHGYADCESLCLTNILFDPRRLPLPEHQLRQMPGYHALFKLEPELRVQHSFNSRLRIDNEGLRKLGELLLHLNQEIVERKPGFEVASTSLLCGVLVELSRRYAAMTSPMPQTLVRLSGLLNWLEKHLSEPVTVNLLAARAHMSRSTLGRCFRESFGLSPMGYVIEMRLSKAATLLRETELHIRDVALRVGIEDANYFSRVFRKQLGVEPTAYRSRNRTPKLHHVA